MEAAENTLHYARVNHFLGSFNEVHDWMATMLVFFSSGGGSGAQLNKPRENSGTSVGCGKLAWSLVDAQFTLCHWRKECAFIVTTSLRRR
jgi:hypothetical protein